MTKRRNKLIMPGHNACAGCGQLVAVQAVMRALDKNTIISNATGCLEVTTTAHPQSAWNLPWIHSLFENASAVASGIKAALNKKKNKKTKVVIQAGDGGTYDIGLGLISGMWERNENILYVCYDTEAYSNTGIQASGATPYGASTTTTPAGKKSIGSQQRKKNMIDIALAHGLQYVCQSAAGFPDDITRKVKRALKTDGPTYIQILSPCVPGWKIKSNESVLMGQLAVETALYPLLEYQQGKLVSSSVSSKFKPKNIKQYLEKQKRFKHLDKKTISEIEKNIKNNIKKYSLN